jgi:hypothetical protein
MGRSAPPRFTFDASGTRRPAGQVQGAGRDGDNMLLIRVPETF